MLFLLIDDDEFSDEEIHTLRIEFKKLRYLFESFPDAIPKKHKIKTQIFKGIQDAFGFFTDLGTFRSFLQNNERQLITNDSEKQILFDPLIQANIKIKKEIGRILTEFIRQMETERIE